MTYFDATLRDLLIGEGSPYPFSAVPDGLGLPEVRQAERVPLPGGGAVPLGPDESGVRTLVFECRLRFNSQAEHRAAERALVTAWKPATVDIPMEVTVDGDPRIVYGRPIDCAIRSDRSRVENHLSWARCVFSANDPLWYSTELKMVPVGMPTAGDGITVASGGVTVASGGVAVIGGGSAGNASALNAGTGDVDWTARLLGPIVSPRVTVNQKTVVINGTIPAGSWATFDSKTRVFRLSNEQRSWIDPVLSEWSKLPAGEPTTVALRGESGTGRLELTWRDGDV